MGGGPCGESGILGGDTLGGVLDGGSAGDEGLDEARGEDAPSLPNMRPPSLCSRASVVACLCGTGGRMLSAEVPGQLGLFRAGRPIAGFREHRG